MKYIVNFSGGLCSFWAAYRTVEQFGAANVIPLFADVLIEDLELYRFNVKSAEILGLQITRVSKELTPWELFRREGLIGNDRFPICSTKLKREPLNEWMEQHYEMDSRQGNAMFESAAVVLGFDWLEEHRVQAFQREHPTWTVEAPMTVAPLWSKCRMQTEAKALGLEIPRLYKKGFPHNNCGGRCVRAGITHWVHLYRTFPDRYLEWENDELRTIAEFKERGIEPLTILKDRRGGETKSLTLRDLRLRIEAGETFSKFDWGGCGCGG